MFKSILKVFENIVIITFYFHLMNNCNKKLPELKNNNNQKLALDIIANIKLLCFININNLLHFFQKIKSKQNRKFPNFIKYFEKNYII